MVPHGQDQRPANPLIVESEEQLLPKQRVASSSRFFRSHGLIRQLTMASQGVKERLYLPCRTQFGHVGPMGDLIQ